MNTPTKTNPNPRKGHAMTSYTQPTFYDTHGVETEPTALAEHGDRLVARNDDPDSSHAAAARDFDIPQGLRGMKVDIYDALLGAGWQTCRQIAEAIYGSGPYTYEEAVGLNKVQTVALNLWREGHIDRRHGPDGRLEYAQKGWA